MVPFTEAFSPALSPLPPEEVPDEALLPFQCSQAVYGSVKVGRTSGIFTPAIITSEKMMAIFRAILNGYLSR
ncbi:hypothetical protein D3C80_2141430 [compost metagenome]